MAKTILIVEDNALVMKVYHTALASLGCAIVQARNAEEALDEARRAKPDVVVMDIMLPGVSGLDLARQLKADPELKAIPLIAVTTLAAGEQAKIKEAGCDAYLAKPINVDGFVRKVKEYLGT